jgi:hypothetical protein
MVVLTLVVVLDAWQLTSQVQQWLAATDGLELPRAGRGVLLVGEGMHHGCCLAEKR